MYLSYFSFSSDHCDFRKNVGMLEDYYWQQLHVSVFCDNFFTLLHYGHVNKYRLIAFHGLSSLFFIYIRE